MTRKSIIKTMLILNLLLAGGSGLGLIVNTVQSGAPVLGGWFNAWPVYLPSSAAILSALGLLRINWAKPAAFIFGAGFFGIMVYAIMHVSFEDLQRGFSLGVFPFVLCMLALCIGNLWACYVNWKEMQVKSS